MEITVTCLKQQHGMLVAERFNDPRVTAPSFTMKLEFQRNVALFSMLLLRPVTN